MAGSFSKITLIGFFMLAAEAFYPTIILSESVRIESLLILSMKLESLMIEFRVAL